MIRTYAEELVAGRRPAYDVGWNIWETAFASVDESTDGQHCHGLWLVWGPSTDWVENRPDERTQAEAAMRRAAAEWLEVAADEQRWRTWLDRWIYDEMGYERPAPT